MMLIWGEEPPTHTISIIAIAPRIIQFTYNAHKTVNIERWITLRVQLFHLPLQLHNEIPLCKC